MKDWDRILNELKLKRKDPRNERFRKDPSRINITSISPCNVSLIER